MKNLIRRYFETKIETRKSMARSQEIYAYVEVGKFAFKVGNTDLLDKSLERILELIEH